MIVLRDHPREGPQVLLTKRAKNLKVGASHWVFPGGKIDSIDQRDDPVHTALNAAVRETLEEVGLVIAGENCFYFSHWLTPEDIATRFSTWFFVGESVDPDDDIIHDPLEVEESVWISPDEALSRILDSEMSVMPPVFVTLVMLRSHLSVKSILTHAQNTKPITYRPRLVESDSGILSLYEEDAGYEAGASGVIEPVHRTYFGKDGIRYINSMLGIDFPQ